MNTNRFITVTASFIVVVAGMKLASPIIVPFLLSVFISIICSPALYLMKKKGIPTAPAILLLVMAIIGIGLLLGVFIGNSVQEFSSNIPEYKIKLREQTHEVVQWVEARGFDVNEDVVYDRFNPGTVMQLVANTLSGITGLLTKSFLILLTVVFILMEASSFPRKLNEIERPGISYGTLTSFVQSVNRYLAIKTVFSLMTGGLVIIALSIMGVDYPFLWGVIAFLLNFIPNIGSIIAAIPAVLLAIVQLGIGPATVVALIYLAINTTIGSIIEPRFMGNDLGLSPLVVFLSLVFWGWVLGPVGMLLSIPLTMVVKIALESSDESRWIAVLLGS